MKISVIITAYNIEQWVAKAISSIINQSYRDLEIIIVEDCSTDNTLSVINTFQDPRIKLIQHSQNMGAGLSRRDGILNATGEFTILIDGDDYISENFIESLVRKQLETGSDIVSGGITYLKMEGGMKAETFGDKVSTGLQKFIDYGNGQIVFLNNKLVRRSMYDTVIYSDRRFCEDTPVVLPLLYYANSVAYIDNPGYYYLQRDSSLCHSVDQYEQNVLKALCAKDMIEFFSDKEPEYLKLISVSLIVYYIKLALQSNPTEELIQKLSTQYFECTKFLLRNI